MVNIKLYYSYITCDNCIYKLWLLIIILLIYLDVIYNAKLQLGDYIQQLFRDESLSRSHKFSCNCLIREIKQISIILWVKYNDETGICY